MKYAITGATGKFGRNAILDLLKLVKKDEIVALARNTKKAADILPQGIEIREADYTNEEGLERAFAGIDRLLFISSIPGGEYSREKQHLNVVNAARKAGISFIAYTSFPHADQAQSPLSADHKATEKAISESGIRHSFLRNNWYLENQLDLIQGALAGNPVVYSAQNGHVGWALEREYAEGAVKVLVSNEPKEVYEFAGQPITYADLATVLAEISSKKFEVSAVTDDEYRRLLETQGTPAPIIDVIIMIQNLIKNDELAKGSRDLEEVLGHKLVPLKEAIEEAVGK